MRWLYVDKKLLDLYWFKKVVEVCGGFEKVCKLKKWVEIGCDLGYSGKIMLFLFILFKNLYQKWFCFYEEYLWIVKFGVYQQLELEYGGFLIFSLVQSLMKWLNVNMFLSFCVELLVRYVIDVLQVIMNGYKEID